MQETPNARLHFYGEGSERGRIEARIKAFELENHVVLEGYCTDVASIYRDAHCVVLTSSMEGFSLTLLEAMVFRCPVVAFDVRYGPGDMIVSGETGFLVPPGDQDAFAQHLIDLIKAPALADTLGMKEQERFKSRFSPATVARLWAETISDRF